MILRSPFVGKASKKLGDAAYYVRKGVQCARVLTIRKENYKATPAQAAQQKVFRFLKQNYDANALAAFVRAYCDAKPKAGRSQTAYNLFYAAVLPFLVSQKPAIIGLADDEMINAKVFLGTANAGLKKMTEGVLGALPVESATNGSIVIDVDVMNECLAKANSLLSAKAVPFTLNDFQFGYISISVASNGTVSPLMQTSVSSFVTPSVEDGKATFSVAPSLSIYGDDANVVYFARLAKNNGSGDVDTMSPIYAFDSFNGSYAAEPIVQNEPEEDEPVVQ